MPITPRKGEEKDAFVARCMHELSGADATDRPNDQKVAICMSAWSEHKPKQMDMADCGDDYDTFMSDCIDETGDEEECQLRWDDMNKSAPKIENRAYSILNIKRFNDDERVIEGIATTPSTDRVGDIVEPMGAKFNLPFPLLWQHRADEPVGYVEAAQPAHDGIKFRARIAKIEEPGELKNLCDKAWQAIKAKLVKAVSIGFTITDSERLQKGGSRIKTWNWLELSLVTIPANSEASIHTIRSIDAEFCKQSKLTAGAAKSTVVKLQEKPVMAKKTITEQVSAFEATRGAKSARMEEIAQTSGDSGETFNVEQTEEYDRLASEVKAVDEHLNRLRVLEKMNITKAIEIPRKVENIEDASRARDPIRVTTHRRELEKGVRMVRFIRALWEAQGNYMYAADLAKQNEQWQAESPEVEGALREVIRQKTAVVPGDAATAAWAGTLVQYQYLATDFAEYLYPLTIIGRIPGLRRVPFKVRVPRQTSAATVSWVGEGKAKPLTSVAFDSVTLDYAKIAGIIPITEELIRLSNPSAETIVRDSLSSAIVKFMDSQFIDPTKAADDVSPASITNGLTAIVPSGTNAASFRSDINRLLDQFLTNNYQMGGAVWIMTQTNAMRLANMVNTLGQAEFPSVQMQGGSLLGIPIIASQNLPATTGSPSEGWPIILALANEILLADDGAVTIDLSREASLQMETAPDSPPTASTVTVSLWQNNLVAIKAERFINWKLRRTNAVSYIQSAVYSG